MSRIFLFAKMLLFTCFSLTNGYNSPQYTRNIAREHFKLVPYFAKPVMKKHHLVQYERDEVIQEGYLGLMYAARKYNPDLNIEFSTYSSHWIRSYISKYMKKRYGRLPTTPFYPNEHIKITDTNTKFDNDVLFDLNIALNTLEPWEYELIKKRFFDKITIKDIANEYGLSRNTISKHSRRIVSKLRGHMLRQYSQP